MTALLLSLIVAVSGYARDVDPTLVQLAETRVQEVAADQYAGGHRYLEELNTLAPKYLSWGEVIGWNQWYESPQVSAENIVRSWMESDTHRSILKNSTYNRVGCSILAKPDAEYFYVCILAQGLEHMPQLTEPPIETPNDPPVLLPNTAMPANA